MKTHQPIVDERARAVAASGSQIGYAFLIFALLIDGAYRAAAYHQNTLDLMGLIAVSGAISWLYRTRHNVKLFSTKQVTLFVCFAAVLGFVVSIGLVLLGKYGVIGWGPGVR